MFCPEGDDSAGIVRPPEERRRGDIGVGLDRQDIRRRNQAIHHLKSSRHPRTVQIDGDLLLSLGPDRIGRRGTAWREYARAPRLVSQSSLADKEPTSEI